MSFVAGLQASRAQVLGQPTIAAEPSLASWPAG